MKTIKQIIITPIYVEYIPDVSNMIQNEIYISKKYETSVHLCLCGCGNEVVTPLHDNWWNLVENDLKISISPSIGNFNLPCKSHYIITKNKANFV